MMHNCGRCRSRLHSSATTIGGAGFRPSRDLLRDRDAGGLKATEHDFYTLARQGIKAYSVTVPGDDPADAWQREPGLMQNTMATLDTARQRQSWSLTTTSSSTETLSGPTTPNYGAAWTTPAPISRTWSAI